MKELEKIVVEVDKARAAGKTAALATVVDIQGSGYRLPGARMLIVDGLWVAGSISGGCLEEDVILRAGEATKNDEVIIATYDTTGDDDIVFGVGLGCKGVIRILIEPVRPLENGLDFAGFARTCFEQRAPGVVATVVRVEGQVNTTPGCRALALAGDRTTDIEDVELKAKILAAIEERFTQPAALITLTLRQGTAEVFIESIDPPTPMVIFGAGHDAMPIVRLAKEIGWHVTIVDHRQAYAAPARFPLADRVVLSTPEQVFSNVALTDATLAVVMTHNYLRDLKLLALLLTSRMRYIGLLGPRKRTEQLLADLRRQGVPVGPEQLSRLYAPVGLDIGSESPAEVALSIVAEMQAVVANRVGGSLRDRQYPIHGRPVAPAHAAYADT